MNKFSATIEFLSGRSAIVTLTDAQGEWAGAGRIEVKHGSKSVLYELGYTRASMAASDKGGRLETYVCDVPCPHRIEFELARRRANALNVEPMQMRPRYKLKPPDNWPNGQEMVTRWLWSGGDGAVLGLCTRPCPERRFPE